MWIICEVNLPKSDMLYCKLISNMQAKITDTKISNNRFTPVKSLYLNPIRLYYRKKTLNISIKTSCQLLTKSSMLWYFTRLRNHQCRMVATLILSIPMFTFVLDIYPHTHVFLCLYRTRVTKFIKLINVWFWRKGHKMIFTFGIFVIISPRVIKQYHRDNR